MKKFFISDHFKIFSFFIQEKLKQKNNKIRHFLKDWEAPEWVPKDIPSVPKQRVKERLKYLIIINRFSI